MNLNDGIRAVAAIVDFESEDTGYDVIIGNMFNRHQQAIFAMHAWTFAQQDFNILLRTDYSTGSITATANSYAVDGVATEWDLDMARAWIYMPDEKWYRIGRVDSPTKLYLEQKYAGAGAVTQIYTIRFRYYAMPRDAVDMLGIVCRRSAYQPALAAGKSPRAAVAPADASSRPLEYISPVQEQQFPLTEDDTGKPSVFLEARPWRQRAPDQTLAVSTAATGGSIPAGTKYRYCHTWMLHGAESPPSNIVSVTVGTTTSTNTVTVTGIREALTTLPRTGRLYRADDQNAFYLLAEGDFSTGAFLDNGTTYEVNREVPLLPEGTYHYLRFWPRPAEVELLDLRYHARPATLANLTDVFALPTEYHDMLVHFVLGDVFSKHGDAASANFYRKRAREALDAMQARYLSHTPDIAVRQPWTSVGTRRRIVGTPRLIS